MGRGWTRLEQLSVGDALATRAGPALVVQSVTVGQRPQGYLVYNLTVEGDHTDFVGKANGGIWAHNTLPCPDALRGKAFPKSIDEMKDMLGFAGERTSAGNKWNIKGWTLKAEAHGPKYNGENIAGHSDLHFHISDPDNVRLPSSGNFIPNQPPHSFVPGEPIPSEW